MCHLPQEPHSQGFTVAIAKILHCSYFTLLVCGWKRNQWTPDFRSHQHHPARPQWKVSATSWWTFSAVSQTSLAFQRRENSAFGSTCGKCNLTYQENTHCTGKCRFFPELLNLERGKEKYSIIKLSPEEKQMTQSILGTLFLHWPWKPRKKRHLEELVAKPFLVRLFLVSLPPAPCFLSKHSHSDHKIWSKLSYTSAVIPFWVSPSILHALSQSLVFVTRQKQPQLSTAPASSSLLLQLPEPQLIIRNQATPLQICPVQLKLPDSTA